MKLSYAIGSLALAASSALAAPQGVTESIPPTTPASAGCSTSHSGQFQVSVQGVSANTKVKRDALKCTLADGILKDAKGRTGYIASNFQFQFDGPPQAGAIYTSGFSLCANGSLSLGGSAIWYQCLSGGFYNLYDRSWAAQCSPIHINAIGYTSGAETTPASVQTAGAIAGVAVPEQTDGQPIAVTAAPPTGVQVNATAPTGPVAQTSDGQVQAPQAQVGTPASGVPVKQLPDGQVYNPPVLPKGPGPVTQISDGQVQAPPASGTSVPVTQIADGQVQATAGNTTVTTSKPSQVTVNAVAALQVARGTLFAGLIAAAAALL